MSATRTNTTVVKQEVPWRDMQPVERFLLGRLFRSFQASDEHGVMPRGTFHLLDEWPTARIGLYAEDGVNTTLSFTPNEISHALALSSAPSQYVRELLSRWESAAAMQKADDEEMVAIDAGIEDAICILTGIVMASRSIQYLVVESSYLSLDLTKGVFGGAAWVITKFGVEQVDTRSFVSEILMGRGMVSTA